MPRHARRAAHWLCALVLLAGGCSAAPNAPRTVLTSIRQIRAMNRAEAEAGYPVRIRGTVTYAHPGSRSLMVQAGDEGISVDTGDRTLELRPGHEVEVEGSTGPG